MKQRITLFLLCLMATIAYADEVRFSASAPQQVVVGKPFQLTYTVTERSKDLRAPEMDNFDILAGPYTSQSSSTSWVNGKRTSSFTQTYTYTLAARKEGSYTIAPASITVGHTQYNSNGLKITVLPADETPANQSGSASAGTGTAAANDHVSNENIFIRTVVSKTRLAEQECMLLQYKLYFAGVDVTQFTNNTKIPEFKGFLKQELEQGEIQTQLEHYNGRNYNTAVLYQTLLYPQHSGEIQIDPAQFEAVLRVQTRAQVRSIFDDFFGSYTNVTRSLTAPGVKIKVDALPKGKPQDFSGGVGHFSIKSQISATEIDQNEAVTLRIEISGSGNMKLLKTPAVDFPEGFEQYDPKVTNNFKTTTSGMSGTKSIEYLFIPRAAGEYTIPAVSFSYYDTQSKQYVTHTTSEYTLRVRRTASGDQQAAVSNYVGKEDIKQLGTDIRYIHTAGIATKSKDSKLYFGSLLFYLCYLIPLALSLVLFLIFRKKIRERADIARMRYKKAGKVAQKRLKQAKQYMLADNKKLFYEEIERAALTYLSDRLSIPTAELNKENIAEMLSRKQVSDDLIRRTTDVLSTAEFARYAPQMGGHEMQDLYEQTAKLIEDIENAKI